jgi:chemotaxis methyl-accepting protein methylase
MRPALQRVFENLFAQSGIDFNQYKLPTVLRRIERRLLVLGCMDVSDYADRLAESQEEREQLRRELLIPVTSFFRDAAAFKILLHQLLVPMVRRCRPTLKCWTAATRSIACSGRSSPRWLCTMALAGLHRPPFCAMGPARRSLWPKAWWRPRNRN